MAWQEAQEKKNKNTNDSRWFKKILNETSNDNYFYAKKYE